jgi:hypothetical protein
MTTPITVLASKGGPYDDVAFLAGMTCGSIDRDLAITAAVGTLPREWYVDSRLVPQVELVAAHHGYSLRLIDDGLDELPGLQAIGFDWSDVEPPTASA